MDGIIAMIGIEGRGQEKRYKNGGQKKVAFAFLDVSWVKDGLRQFGLVGCCCLKWSHGCCRCNAPRG
jgi:hypothetical protein